jgi:hypothetical protein
MLIEMMRECRNFFELRNDGFYVGNDKNPKYPVVEYEGDYAINTGVLSTIPTAIKTGQYIAIYGSTLNDGVWKVGASGALTGDAVAQNETFHATIYPLKVPPDFVTLATEITAWRTAAKESSPYVSESFLGYSYSKSQKQGGGTVGWQQQFSDRLAPYRRMFRGLPL